MLARFTLAIYGLMLLGFGVGFVLAPLKLAGLVDITTYSGIGTMELRAFYGGIEIGLGALFLVALFRPALQHTALIVLGCSFAGIALGRLVGLAADEYTSPQPWWFLATEVFAVILSVVGLQRRAQRHS